MKPYIQYLEKVWGFLGTEYPKYFSSFDVPRHYGLRVNPLKIGGKDGWTLICVEGFPLGWAKRQAD